MSYTKGSTASDTNTPVTTAKQSAFDLKANIEIPTFTETAGSPTKGMVGIGNVDITQQSALVKYQFVHIPKNGGAAFSAFIRENYKDVFENPPPPYHQFIVDSSDNPIVILRDPLDRVSSIYQFWNNGSEIFNESRALTFDEFLEGAENIIKIISDDERDIDSIIKISDTMPVPFLALPQSKWLRQEDYHKTIVIKYQTQLDYAFSSLLSELDMPNSDRRLELFNVTKKKTKMNFSSKQINKIIVLYFSDFLLWHDVFNCPEKFKKVVRSVSLDDNTQIELG